MAGLRRPAGALGLCLLAAAAEAGGGGGPLGDAAVLVQAHITPPGIAEQAANLVGLGLRYARGSVATGTSEAVEDWQGSPLVRTPDGPIKGVHENGCQIFKKIPYGTIPKRFARSEPPQPWGTRIMDGTKYGPGCIGSHTQVAEVEDCLSLNVWVPEGNHTNMPVIAYFHGGMNQHGSGQEMIRQGDGIAQSTKYPTIFVNFDYRMGIMGWIYGKEEDGIFPNVGLHDQQAMLGWVQRNIRSFGGDPSRVTLDGQSEGAGAILVHMAAPGSRGLFSRAIFHSPPADMWSRDVNRQRTEFMAGRLGCHHETYGKLLECLRKVSAQKLWSMDWVSEELSRGVGTLPWAANVWGLTRWASTNHSVDQTPTMLGWHAIVDGKSLPGEPRDLISKGQWNKVPVLLTVSKNETRGVFPSALPGPMQELPLQMALKVLSRAGDGERLKREYAATLESQGIKGTTDFDLMHQLVTDKMWTCDVRALAEDINAGGGEAFVGMWWHSPKYDPVGVATNPVCAKGATCHAAEMLYALPQKRGFGMIQGPGMEEEIAYSEQYRDQILAFVHGDKHQWAPYDAKTQVMTFTDSHGARVVPGYRKEQCDVLDTSMGEELPSFHHRRNQVVLQRLREAGEAA